MKSIEFHQVRQILNQAWDPIGVGDVAACQDEYDSYAYDVCRMLNGNYSAKEIQDYLYEIESEFMGLEPSIQRIDNTVTALKKLKQ
ncbi:hypothetical protein [Acinetobacter thermotolerans]|uniref:hypothetical protein n=1 Tax=Acinetobacter thermotolerans TaxID=3151487 RepID=UPI00325B48AF